MNSTNAPIGTRRTTVRRRLRSLALTSMVGATIATGMVHQFASPAAAATPGGRYEIVTAVCWPDYIEVSVPTMWAANVTSSVDQQIVGSRADLYRWQWNGAAAKYQWVRLVSQVEHRYMQDEYGSVQLLGQDRFNISAPGSYAVRIVYQWYASALTGYTWTQVFQKHKNYIDTPLAFCTI